VSLLLGYNTNGFAHHRLEDALDVLARIGYRSVGLTLDVHHAPPGATDYGALAERLRAAGLLPVVETGARFLLDSDRKHQPSLLSIDGRERRLRLLLDCVGIAAALGSPCISLWSGRDEGGESWEWLVDGLGPVCDRADESGIDVAFESEPGMFIDTMERFDELRRRLPHPRLKLTLDVGHLHCTESGRPGEWIDRYADLLCNVHLDDHRRALPARARCRGHGGARLRVPCRLENPAYRGNTTEPLFTSDVLL
jgi:sugar phosphate isomerase/epimerase